MTRRNAHLPIGWALALFLAAMTAAAPATGVGEAAPPAAAPATGVLEVDVTAPGAILRIDGHKMGSAAGFRQTLPAGDHKIEISAPGYQALRLTVHVPRGGVVPLRPLLARVAPRPARPQALGGTSGFTPLPPILGTTRGLPAPGVSGGRPRAAPILAAPAAAAPPPRKPAPPPAPAAAIATAPAPAAPVSPAASLAKVEEELQRLVPGNVAFDTPAHMERGRSRVIEARLAVDLPPDALMQQLEGAGPKQSRPLEVGDRMIATLSGGEAFDISPSGPQQQFISRQRVTAWTWEVTPKTLGTHILMLTFDVALTVDGREGTRKIRTLTHEIQVQVAWADRLKEGFERLKAMVDGIVWLWITILVPAGLSGLWIWRQIGKRRRSGPPRQPPQAADRRLRRRERRSGAAALPMPAISAAPAAAPGLAARPCLPFKRARGAIMIGWGKNHAGGGAAGGA